MIELKYGTRKVVNFRGAKKVVGGLTDQNKIHVLLHISKELANAGNEEDLFTTVTGICKEIFECENTTLRLYDGELLVPVKYLKDTQPPRRNLTEQEGYSGKTFVSGDSLLISDLKYKPEYLDDQETTRCVMCVPIVYKEEKLGVISVESEVAFFYKEDDLEILEALGSQLALALTGVRLIEGLMTARAREAAVLSQLEWDLKMGRNVQSQIVSKDILPWNGIHFTPYYEPMVEVSGDYYSVVRMGNTVTIIMVDVSGHGIPAALVTMAIHYKFHRCVEQGLGLSEIMEEMGESLKPQLPESTYFTAFILRIYSDYSYSYINGGHQKTIHVKNDSSIDLLDSKGLPLGILDVKKQDYEEKHGILEPGEVMVLYSDGIPEQKSPEREEYGKDRFLRTIMDEKKRLQQDNKGAIIVDALNRSILEKWLAFKQDSKNGDDITMLILQINPQLDSALPLIQTAKSAHRQRNELDAYKMAREAYEIDPSLKDNLLFLGKLCYNEKKFHESHKFIHEYIQTSGEDTAIIHYLYAKSLFKFDKISDSKRALKKSLSCDPSFAKASLLLAKCYLIENALPKAIKTLQQGIKSSPSSDPLRSVLQKLENIKTAEGNQ